MKRLTALLALGLFVSSVVSPVSASADTRGERSRVRWQPCHEEFGPGFDCASVNVPLDYERPRGKQISLALVRLRASGPQRKTGSIFLNPGGPGGSGVDFVLGAGPFLFSDDVRARFDLIGFDPRGIIGSDPLLCFRTLDEAFSVVPPFAFPMTDHDEALVEKLDGKLNRACQHHGGRIVDHMATADVARDLDLLRQAVGDSQLSYAGYSYGSFLGVTYANMFPDKVRALVVDGVLDPIAWTTGLGDEAKTLPFSTRLRSDVGAQATLEQFFRLCDEAGPASCAFAGDAGTRFAALTERLRAAPIQIVDPVTGETFPIGYADFIGFSLGNMYSSFGWPFFAEFLALIEASAAPTVLGEALRASEDATGLTVRGRARELYPNFVEGFPGVACSDSINPDDHDYWSQAGAAADDQIGYFGRIWTWASSPCAVWEGFDSDRYLGPFDRSTANPVLVVGNRYDPATRYEGAVRVNQLLPNSSLLTVEGWGHTSLFLSTCADQVVSQYLLDGTTPQVGTVCNQDFGPFQTVTARADNGFAQRAQVRADAMTDIALFPGR
jgi:pimeloyl-ACP methyl ester carboxylesterase